MKKKRLVVVMVWPFMMLISVLVMFLAGLGLLSGYFYIRYGEADTQFCNVISKWFKQFDKLFAWAERE